MFDSSLKPERSWQNIVAEAATASRQHNLERLADLRKELEDVLSRRRDDVLHAETISHKPRRKRIA
jgi:hypothetical protein